MAGRLDTVLGSTESLRSRALPYLPPENPVALRASQSFSPEIFEIARGPRLLEHDNTNSSKRIKRNAEYRGRTYDLGVTNRRISTTPVSYTHLTLPTKRIV